MADGRMYLSASRKAIRGDITDFIDLVVGELGLPEEWEDRIFVVFIAGKLFLVAKEAVSEGFGFALPDDAIGIAVDATKLSFIIERWTAAGRQVGRNGELILWSPRMGVDP